MRIPRTVAAYIAREIIQYSVLGFLVFASLMLTQNLLRTLSDLAEAAGSATAGDLVQVLLYLAPVLALLDRSLTRRPDGRDPGPALRQAVPGGGERWTAVTAHRRTGHDPS